MSRSSILLGCRRANSSIALGISRAKSRWTARKLSSDKRAPDIDERNVVFVRFSPLNDLSAEHVVGLQGGCSSMKSTMLDTPLNLKTVKIEFRHFRFLLSFFLFSFFFSAPSAFTRAVPRPKHRRTVVKFSWQVPFELCV